MFRLLSLIGMIILAAIRSASADCNASFVASLKDEYNLDQSTSLKSSLHERFCRNYSEAGSQSLGGQYGAFKLDYGSSSSSAEAFCRQKDQNTEFSEIMSIAYRALSPEAVRSLGNCFVGFQSDIVNVRQTSTTVRISYSDPTNQGVTFKLVSAKNSEGLDCNVVPGSNIGNGGQDFTCPRSQKARAQGDDITIRYKEAPNSEPVSKTLQVPADKLFKVEYYADFVSNGTGFGYSMKCKEKGQLSYGSAKDSEKALAASIGTSLFSCRSVGVNSCRKMQDLFEQFCAAEHGPYKILVGTTDEVISIKNEWFVSTLSDTSFRCERRDVPSASDSGFETDTVDNCKGGSWCHQRFVQVAECRAKLGDNLPLAKDR